MLQQSEFEFFGEAPEAASLFLIFHTEDKGEAISDYKENSNKIEKTEEKKLKERKAKREPGAFQARINRGYGVKIL